MNKEKTTENPRAAAMASLLAWEKEGRYANLEINASLSNSKMSGADRGLYTALVYGVIERAITLDYTMAHLSARPIEKIDESVRCAIRLGLYQLAFMDRIPPHAAVSETVALMPKHTRGFINAILRTFLREGCTIPLPKEENNAEYLSVLYSTPTDLCRFFIDSYGLEKAGAILEAFLRHTPVTVRVNTLKTTMDEALSYLKDADPEISPLSDDMITVSSAANIADGVKAGLFFVQDPASRLAIRALDPKPGETVIDTCAAPGGKSFSAAIDMNNDGKLYSFDLHENKISLIRRTAGALGIKNLTAEAQNAKNPREELIGTADRVLCDAPCSGLGVIGKKPDIKYKPISAIQSLPSVQYDVLKGASLYVRPGGVLVYSTCTLNPKENEEVVTRFLKENPDFAPAPFSLGKIGDVPSGTRTFFPDADGCDGFFIAKMIRKN
ncbi:MAG: 16S rRNA (cytosine(967)-C(5))-methyltransferase RsmB [Clostridia bacterium]|nr:16S rRNA (cytosine(967)-C(5))-methyltransferase RsmB [Clostridia bacterium]